MQSKVELKSGSAIVVRVAAGTATVVSESLAASGGATDVTGAATSSVGDELPLNFRLLLESELPDFGRGVFSPLLRRRFSETAKLSSNDCSKLGGLFRLSMTASFSFLEPEERGPTSEPELLDFFSPLLPV